jgi:FAD/FMN-containing dehydrogenase
MLFGARGTLALSPGEPTLFVYGDLYAENEAHLAVKEKILEEVLGDLRREGGRVEDPLDVDQLVKINPAFVKLAEFPTTLDFLLDYGPGGITWVGSYGPGSRWTEGVNRSFAILESESFPPILVARPMKGGHFWVLRFILHFDRQDPRDVERVRRALERVADCLLELNYIPYKPPGWAVRKMRERDSGGFFDLLQRIKGCLDPHGILNPGRWGL